MHFIFISFLFLQTLLVADELKIKAVKFYADEKAGLSVFTGDVNIVKGDDELNASQVTVHIDTNKKPTKFVAQGDVAFRLKTLDGAQYEGRAQKAEYLPNEKIYNFYTDVHLKQLGDTKEIQGDEVILKVLENKAYAKGQKKKPVIMIFDIDEKKEKEVQ
ncbi:MAG: lipopolysaccharide transport periplasmic protein LptA [Epsilonproteobacteria bacterium]|nr:lipopolysaccharide transport periplasmic protein LptA [Campylobacterota bacterium]